MIAYESGSFLRNLWRINGSVFPKAIYLALPNSIITGTLVLLIWQLEVPPLQMFQAKDSVMLDTAIWGGFSFLVGFLVVFRTSQAYNRFWEGCSTMQKMGAEWFDACSSIMAFTSISKQPREKVLSFQNTLIRLFSMLHAAAMAEIEDCADSDNFDQVAAFNMEIIDADAVDVESMQTIRNSDCKVELVFQWIQLLLIQNIDSQVLSIPPPILSRAFQELSNGMIHFNEALNISNVPFPFPYAQTCDCLLLMHWVLVPVVVSQWTNKAWWGVAFSFLSVFTLWTLNLIAVELENPFGEDPNDIDGLSMQQSINSRLRMLINPTTRRLPFLTIIDQEILLRRAIDPEHRSHSSFNSVWFTARDDDEDNVPQIVRRRSAPNRALEMRRSQNPAGVTSVAAISSGASVLFSEESDHASSEKSTSKTNAKLSHTALPLERPPEPPASGRLIEEETAKSNISVLSDLQTRLRDICRQIEEIDIAEVDGSLKDSTGEV